MPTFECCWRFQTSQDYEKDYGPFSDFYEVEAGDHKDAAELFADHAHVNLGMWEAHSDEWDGEGGVAVRAKGEAEFQFFNITRVAVPLFTASPVA